MQGKNSTRWAAKQGRGGPKKKTYVPGRKRGGVDDYGTRRRETKKTKKSKNGGKVKVKMEKTRTGPGPRVVGKS